jgi:zinc protease
VLRLGITCGVLFALASLSWSCPARAAEPSIERLPNGLTIVSDPRPGAPVTAVQVWVRAGAIDEAERTLGLAHFLEHMLFKGTDSRPVGSIHAEVEKNGGEINAATSDDWTYYHITIASASFRRALEIICDIAANASFPEEEVDREREVVKEEIARRDDNPIALLYDNIGAAAFRVHPYRYRVIGNETSLAEITRDEFVRFYRDHYVPNRMAVVLVGDFDTAAARALIASTLGRLPRSSRREPSRPVEPVRLDPAARRITSRTALTYGAVAYPAPPGRDFRPSVAGDVLVEILAGDGIGRLRKLLVEERRIADGVSVSYPTSRDPSLFAVTYTARPDVRDLVEREIRREIRRLRVDGVAEAEVHAALDAMRRDQLRRDESASDRAFHLGFWFAVSRPEHALEYDRAVASITAADVNDFIRRFLIERRGVAVSVDPPAAVAGESGESPLVIRRVHPGGLAAFGVFLPGGQSAEPAPGWASMLSGVINRGVEGRTHEEEEKALAAAGLTVSASAVNDCLSIIGTAEPDRVGLLVDAVFDHIEKPNLGDLEIVREDHLDSLRSRADRPFNVALDRLNALRFGAHPYGRPEVGDETGLLAVDAERLRNFLGALLDPAAMRFVLVGPKGTPEVDARVKERLARLGGGGGGATVAPLPATSPATVTETTSSAQAIVMRSIPAPGAADPAYPVWKVANAVLGGRSSSRLFRIIREERGLAYEVGSFYPTRRLGSHLVLYAGTRPTTAEEVRSMLGVAFDAPTDSELEDAKRLIKGEFALDHEAAARRVWYLGWYAMLGLGPEYDERYPAAIDAVTGPDVARALDEARRAAIIDLRYGGGR